MARLGVDFGTSNSAAGVMAGQTAFVIPLETEKDTIPTAVFVDFAARQFLYGNAAANAMIAGEEGRFLRALKSVLGTPTAREPRVFLNERLTLIEVIARFLEHVRQQSERFTGLQFDSVVSGRPVRFHTRSDALDLQAQADLAQAYDLAGFRNVEFLPEPEAAARAVVGNGRMLIVDIGGGTSDFTLCDRAGASVEILSSGGRRIGGTDFDKALSLDQVMPLLGYGAQIGAELGASHHTAPRGLYHDLASWEKIAFVYDAARIREVLRWARLAVNPRLFERLAEVLDMHLGHDIAYAVEAGKIAANQTDLGHIDLRVVERGLGCELRRDALQAVLGGFAEDIVAGAIQTVTQVGVQPQDVTRVVYVGGSSLISTVRQHIKRAFPNAVQDDAEIFTAVVRGLAHAAG